MTIGLEINDCFFLSKEKISRSYKTPYQYYTKCHFIDTYGKHLLFLPYLPTYLQMGEHVGMVSNKESVWHVS